MRWFVLLVPLLVAATGCVQYTTDVPEAGRALEGSWAMTEIVVISERGENRYPDTAPGLFIFGQSHYSMVWMPLTEVPPDFEDTRNSVRSGSIASAVERTVAGTVESSTASLGCPSISPNVCLRTSGPRLLPPMPSRTRCVMPESLISRAIRRHS